MISFVLHAIPALISKAFPVVYRLVVLIAVFHGLKFLIRQWKGLGKR